MKMKKGEFAVEILVPLRGARPAAPSRAPTPSQHLVRLSRAYLLSILNDVNEKWIGPDFTEVLIIFISYKIRRSLT